jgi:hypothetical protein
MTAFTFIAYRDFKRTLGKMDAVVECAELATRKFIYEAEQASSRMNLCRPSHPNSK